MEPKAEETSQVMGRPFSLAALMTRISSLLATWQMCKGRSSREASRIAAAVLLWPGDGVAGWPGDRVTG